MAVSKRLRYEILRRDNHACRYCGATAPGVALTVDHVVAAALGGSHAPDNLVAACVDCNSGKSATPPGAPLVDDVAADALRWARAMEVVARGRSIEREARKQDYILVQNQWDRWTSTYNDEPFERPTDWTVSVDQLLAAGIGVADIAEAINDTMIRTGIRDRWAYTCGLLWRELDRRHDAARQIVAFQEQRDSGT